MSKSIVTKHLTRAFALLLFLCFAAPALAHVPSEDGCQFRRGPLKWFLTGHEIRIFLELTDEQNEATDALLEARCNALEPLTEQQWALVADLMALLDEADPDLEAVGALVVEIHALNGEIRAIEEQFEADFVALLDDDQLLKYQHGRELILLLKKRTPPDLAV